MKAIIAGLILFGLTATASAQYSRSYQGLGTGSNPNSHYVQPYVNRQGEYTQGHMRTNPDSNPYNNYGTSPNYNPNTNSFGGSRRNSGAW
jgi:hypothetical protein